MAEALERVQSWLTSLGYSAELVDPTGTLTDLINEALRNRHLTHAQELAQADDSLRWVIQQARTRDLVTRVQQFHEAFGIPLGASWAKDERRMLRASLIEEEFREYLAAEVANDPAATLDAFVDLLYVIIGAALEYGFDLSGAFAAVHAANMSKLGPDGKPILRDDGKVLKPEGWKAADLTPFTRLTKEST